MLRIATFGLGILLLILCSTLAVRHFRTAGLAQAGHGRTGQNKEDIKLSPEEARARNEVRRAVTQLRQLDFELDKATSAKQIAMRELSNLKKQLEYTEWCRDLRQKFTSMRYSPPDEEEARDLPQNRFIPPEMAENIYKIAYIKYVERGLPQSVLDPVQALPPEDASSTEKKVVAVKAEISNAEVRLRKAEEIISTTRNATTQKRLEIESLQTNLKQRFTEEEMKKTEPTKAVREFELKREMLQTELLAARKEVEQAQADMDQAYVQFNRSWNALRKTISEIRTTRARLRRDVYYSITKGLFGLLVHPGSAADQLANAFPNSRSYDVLQDHCRNLEGQLTDYELQRVGFESEIEGKRLRVDSARKRAENKEREIDVFISETSIPF